MENLDKIDKSLLDIIQTDFPVCSRPYKILADKTGIGEEEALSRINHLRKNGIIRRLGANFQSAKLGFVSTLCAASVPEKKLEHFVKRVNLESGVTHNYLRNHKYNIWFTLIAPSIVKRDEILSDISAETEVEILNLPATRMYKVRVNFPMEQNQL